MDVELRTHDQAKYLALVGVQRYSDASGFCAELAVRSGGFAGHVRFGVDSEPFVAFVDALERMDRELAGAATLQSDYDDWAITFTVDRAGRVLVSGEVVRYDEQTHRLAFGFHTDQTCLAPFVRDLRACMFAPAV